MKPDRYNLLYFFNELINIAIKNPARPGWGNACSHLIEALILRQENFIKKIVEAKPNNSNEYRLNGAGLKMYWELRQDRDTSDPRFVCNIGGDQAKDYDDFVVKARLFLKERGVSKR